MNHFSGWSMFNETEKKKKICTCTKLFVIFLSSFMRMLGSYLIYYCFLFTINDHLPSAFHTVQFLQIDNDS